MKFKTSMLRECLERQTVHVNNFQIDSIFKHLNDFLTKVFFEFCCDFIVDL